MPCGNFFYYATCHDIEPSLLIIMDNGNQYFEKKKNNVQFFSYCHVSYFNTWMIINDVSMTSWM